MKVFKEYGENGVPLAQYYSGAGGGTIARQMFGFHDRKQYGYEGNIRTRGGLMYYENDGLGNVMDITDRIGSQVMAYRYDAFGNLFTQMAAPYNAVGYTGKTYDAKASLMDYSARWYSPNAGRFINQDTYEGNLSNPQSLNRYSYVDNNPVNFTDPTGHDSLSLSADSSGTLTASVGDWTGNDAYGITIDTGNGQTTWGDLEQGTVTAQVGSLSGTYTATIYDTVTWQSWTTSITIPSPTDGGESSSGDHNHDSGGGSSGGSSGGSGGLPPQNTVVAWAKTTFNNTAGQMQGNTESQSNSASFRVVNEPLMRYRGDDFPTQSSDGHTPTVFIPGLDSGTGTFNGMIKTFTREGLGDYTDDYVVAPNLKVTDIHKNKQNGLDPFITVTFQDSHAHPEDEEKALQIIMNEIKQEYNTNDVNIVAHSMGGLVATQYIESYGQDKKNKSPRVDNLITLGTPYKGSWVAGSLTKSYKHWPAIQDLEPGSKYLKQLQTQGKYFDPNTNVLAVAGGFPFGRGDGVVGQQSASGIENIDPNKSKVTLKNAGYVFHTELENNPGVINDVSNYLWGVLSS